MRKILLTCLLLAASVVASAAEPRFAIDANYCMGLLTASADADLLDPASWTKSAQPEFRSSESNSVYGPGHNSFTTTLDGKTDILVYHAREYRDIVGSELDDPNRNTRAQVLHWKKDGTPDFGVPEANHR
jgi:GH43 family beta-xylosidase